MEENQQKREIDNLKNEIKHLNAIISYLFCDYYGVLNEMINKDTKNIDFNSKMIRAGLLDMLHSYPKLKKISLSNHCENEDFEDCRSETLTEIEFFNCYDITSFKMLLNFPNLENIIISDSFGLLPDYSTLFQLNKLDKLKEISYYRCNDEDRYKLDFLRNYCNERGIVFNESYVEDS